MALNFFGFLNRGKKKNEQAGAVKDSSQDAGGKTPAQVLAEGMINVKDIIAPSAMEIDFNHVKIGNTYYRTIFVSGYPRFVGANWLSPVINFDHSLDISMFYYPVKSKVILDDLRRKITELEATIMTTREKGRVLDPVVVAALEDAKALQEQLVKGVEKYFKFSFYITIPADSLEELENISSRLESTLGSLLLISKVSSLQMEDAFQSTIPTGLDKLLITRNMDTTSLATTFPFTSSDLTMEEGIMYGINKHNGSLIIFDRFSMENANAVVFAKSGSGKSYCVKLEVLRLLIFGAEVLIIDPEEEYRALCEAVGGNYIDFSASSTHKINPFDLSGIAVEGENELGQKLISLITLMKLMLGGLTNTEEAILDDALLETYRLKGITNEPETQMTKEPPVMEDLFKVLMGGDKPESRDMADRLKRFIRGSMAGIFDSQSNINLDSRMTVFSTKNLEEALRPIAFYMILDFIWTRIRKDLRKRILIVEEAWYLMQNEDSAKFIYGIAKRARKYYLGLTTISQDVDDFLTSEYGHAIVNNSSISILLKQHSAAIDKVADVFYLSEGEKRLLLAAAVGEGLFFAGNNHVAIKVMASESEHKLITTDPEEILRLREEGLIKQKQPVKPGPKPAEPVGDTSKPRTQDEKVQPKKEFEKPPQQPPASPQKDKPVDGPKPTQPPMQEKPDIKKPETTPPNVASGFGPPKPPEPKKQPSADEIIKAVQEEEIKKRQEKPQPDSKPIVPQEKKEPQQPVDAKPKPPQPPQPTVKPVDIKPKVPAPSKPPEQFNKPKFDTPVKKLEPKDKPPQEPQPKPALETKLTSNQPIPEQKPQPPKPPVPEQKPKTPNLQAKVPLALHENENLGLSKEQPKKKKGIFGALKDQMTNLVTGGDKKGEIDLKE